ncbi:MAG: hypothetical protein LUC31_00945 [Coprobacillus sp.]|nr:hypothetical protein [Coprobacillus sp.]
MSLKIKLLKATSIVLYVFCGLYFIAAGMFFGLSNYIYWLFLILALISLYDGFLVASVKEHIEDNDITKHHKAKYIVSFILSIVGLASFITEALSMFLSSTKNAVWEEKTEEGETPLEEEDLLKETTISQEIGSETLPVEETLDTTVEEETVKQDSWFQKCYKKLAFWKKDASRDGAQEVVEKPKKEKKEKSAKVKFFTSKSFITMCVSFVLIFILGFSGMCFETSGFSVSVTDFTLTREMSLSYNRGQIHGTTYAVPEGATYSCTVYIPDSATKENPAPTVFVLPGFTRTKMTMSQYAIELSRRGAVVFTIDPGGQGGTTEPSTDGENGMEYLVQYVYNNTDDFKFCDKNRFGAMGHSAGGGDCVGLASDMAGNSYEESIIKSLYVSGYIKNSAASKYNNLRCNAAMSYAYYDEGSYRYQTDTSSWEIIAQRFISEVGNDATSEERGAYEIDVEYGSMEDGTYRVLHREYTNHCFEMYDSKSIANTIDFFDVSLGLNSGLDGTHQTWFGQEASNGLALAAGFTFIVALCAVLMKTGFFKTITKAKEIKEAEDASIALTRDPSIKTIDQISSVGTLDPPLDTPTTKDDDSDSSDGDDGDIGGGSEAIANSDRGAAMAIGSASATTKKHASLGHRITFWTILIVCAIIACLDYIPLANLSIEIFPVGNSASVYTYVFPARMINAILLWAAINGTIGLICFFGSTAIENLCIYIRNKVKGRNDPLDWSKFGYIRIRGTSWHNVLCNTLKALLISVIMIGAFYLMVYVSQWSFHQDFRFMLVSASTINGRMAITALEYIPIIFIFYISNSIRVNCSIAREGWKEWKVITVSMVANCIGLIFILIINYTCFFTTGTVYYGYGASGEEVWLYINMVFALITMMALLPLFNRLTYKHTGNVWSGAVAYCFIFVTMTICASVSYIPV